MSIFDEVKESAEGRELSVRWYRSKIASLGGNSIKASQHIREGNTTGRPTFGMMNLFHYLPKTAKKLPFYDVFPLVVPVDRTRDGFVGINFHYLTIPKRAKLLNLLVDAYGDEERLHFTWRNVSNWSSIRPIVRRYKMRNVNSRILRIPVEDMLIAVLLPVQRFYSGDLDSKRRVVPEVVYNKIRSM